MFSMARKLLVAGTLFLNTFHLVLSGVIPAPYGNLSLPTSNYCTDDRDWIGSGAYGFDCIGAVQRLYDTEVRSRRWPKSDFEFLTPKARVSQIEPMRTPRKYTAGTCTVAIVMLNYFSDQDLPGGVEGPFASRDVTSYWEIWEAASQIQSVCVTHSGCPGWAAEGGREAIGVFMWSTDSDENKRVPDGEAMPPWHPSVGLISNTTMSALGSGIRATS